MKPLCASESSLFAASGFEGVLFRTRRKLAGKWTIRACDLGPPSGHHSGSFHIPAIFSAIPKQMRKRAIEILPHNELDTHSGAPINGRPDRPIQTTGWPNGRFSGPKIVATRIIVAKRGVY